MRQSRPPTILEITQYLLVAFLKRRMSAAYSEAVLDEMDASEFSKTLAFFQRHFPEDLPLSALASDNSRTIAEYKSETSIFFSILDAALPFDSEKKIFGQFDSEKALETWRREGRKEEHLELRPLFSSVVNLGMREKFLMGLLHSEEQLTEVDIKRFLAEVGINNQVTITRLNKLDIAMALHFARKEHKGETKPYQVPLILNRGKTGDIRNQGNHWVYAIITVDPTNNTINVCYRDSLSISSTQKIQINALFKEAVNYSVIERENRKAKRYEAFPNYRLMCDIKGQARQQDPWTCAYHAIRGLLKKGVFKLPEDTAQLENFKKLRDCAHTPEALREAYYGVMLGTLKASAEVLQSENTKIDSDSVFQETSEKKEKKLDERFLGDFLKFVATVPVDLGSHFSTKIMRSQLELESEIEVHYEQVKHLVVFSGNTLYIDIKTIFSEEDTELISRAKSKVLIRLLNEYNSDVQVKFLNTELLKEAPYLNYFIEALDQVSNIQNFSTDTKDFPGQLAQENEDEGDHLIKNEENPALTAFDKALSAIEARNALLCALGVKVDPRGNIWSQLWEKRFSDSSAYGDSYPSMRKLAMFSIASKGNLGSIINFAVFKMGSLYLKELFSFLKKNALFFKNKPGGFPYHTFLLGKSGRNLGYISESLLCSYFQELQGHFNSQGYFPFRKIEIHLPALLTDKIFTELKNLLISAKNSDCLKEVVLYNSGLDLNKEQYESLKSIFEEHDLCFYFCVSADLGDLEINLAKKNLGNIVNKNKDARKRKLSEGLSVEEDSNSLLSLEKAEKKVRFFRFERDYRRGIQLEVNVENQVENQYQLQTQLEQEVQQEIQMQQQQQNDIEDANYVVGLDGLISRKNYEENYSSIHEVVCSVSVFQLYSEFHLKINMGSPSLLEDLWSSAISQYSLPNSIKYLSSAAVSKFNANSFDFCEGVSFDNPFNGFFVEKYVNESNPEESGFILCYDEIKYIENKNQSPLTVILKDKPSTPEWVGDLSQFFSDLESDAYQEYGPVRIATFDGFVDNFGYPDSTRSNIHCLPEKLFAFMRGSNAKLAEEILEKHAWCLKKKDEAVKSAEAFQTGTEIFALADVFYHEGVEGVKKLLDALKILYDKDPTLYGHFKENFIGRNKLSLMDLMTENNLAIISQLADLTPAQKQWWTALISQHVKKVGYADLEALYAGFKYFLEQWPSELTFPPECPIENTGNILVSLDRLLGILSKVHPRNTRDQVFHLKGLDFSQEGAWYAGRWDGFHFFHPAMKLTGKEAIPGKVYKVSYKDLKRLNPDDFETGVTAFHRFVGRADYIAQSYEKYVELMDKLSALNLVSKEIKVRLLPILALATTGSRGSKGFNIDYFLAIVQKLSKDSEDRLEKILENLSNLLPKFSVQPNLEEIGALIQLLYENKPADDDEIVACLEKIKNTLSLNTLQAFSLWQHNSAHISAEEFFYLYDKLQNQDAERMGSLSKVFAIIKKSEDFYDHLEYLIGAFKNIRLSENYDEIISVLSSIDLEKTPEGNLPTIKNLIDCLQELNQLKNPKQVFAEISRILSGCVFNRAISAGDFDLDIQLVEEVRAFNQVLENYGIDPWDIEALVGSDSIQYFKDQHTKLLTVDLNRLEIIEKIRNKASLPSIMLDIAVIEVAKVVINGKISACLKAVYLSPIVRVVAQFPALSALQGPAYFPAPKEFSVENENMVALEHYKNNVGALFETLNRFYKKWGRGFSIDFLLNSPRTSQFSIDQLNLIFNAIENLNLSYAPNNFLKSIFSSQALSDEINVNQLSFEIVNVIEMDRLSILQKSQIIELISKNTNVDFIDNLVRTLQEIENQHPDLLQNIFNLFSEYFKSTNDSSILEKTRELLAIFNNKNDPILIRLFSQLRMDHSLYMQLFTEMDGLSQDSRQDLLKILVYSGLLDRPENSSEDIAIKSNEVTRLLDLAKFHKEDFKKLAQLFDQSPRPGIKRIKEYLDLSSQDREEFFKNYEFDPPGLLSDPNVVKKYFDLSIAATRIDEIIDLNRGQPLFYEDREQLLIQQHYINAVCITHDLTVPGMPPEEAKAYQKPVMQLTKKELQELIKHYRAIISDDKADPQVKKIAKLEFVALAQIAMYRTTGKLPYSTQILSLLNVMLQGGNVFSEIRTGEGKALIAGLFLASEWMKGGAVDITTSNIGLAARDLEELNDFYEYLGIKTSLIRTLSPYKDYQQDGINYSDEEEMPLFLERMQLLGKKMPDKVSLVIDELDSTALDNKTASRYATSLDPSYDPHVNPNEWVYPIILAFVQRQQFIENFIDKESSVEEGLAKLRQFVLQEENQWKHQFSSEEQTRLNEYKAKFSDFSDVQLMRWIYSAYTAAQLKQGEDFVIRHTTIVRNEQEIPVRIARVKINHRESKGSSFSNGVHQFLHARLNLENKGGNCFPIEPEKTYLASKTKKNFIDYYLRPRTNGKKRGNVLGLSGTMGVKMELLEMFKHYAAKLFKIPPHQKLNRTDLPHSLATPEYRGIWPFGRQETAKEAHFRRIKERILEAYQRDQPVLIICDGVHSSQELYDYLEKELTPDIKKLLQLYNGEQERSESDVVAQAAKPGSITISTPILARGTDVKPKNKKYGLYLMGTFIEAERDYGQGIGRSGRNGMPGLSELIISEEEFTRRGRPIPTSDEELLKAIREIQAEMTQVKAKDRAEYQAFGDIKDQFFLRYTDLCRDLKLQVNGHFKSLGADYRALWKHMQRDAHLKWENFLNEIDGKWDELLKEMHSELEKNHTKNHENLLKQKIKNLAAFANEQWKETLEAITETTKTYFKKEYRGVWKNLNKAEDILSDEEIPSLSFVVSKEPVESLPDIDRNQESPMLDISSRRLDASRFSADQAYLDILGDRVDDSAKPALIKNVFEHEIKIIYKKIFGSLLDNKSSVQDGLRLILKTLLERHYKNYVGSSHATSTRLLNRVLFAVKKFGTDEDQQIVYDVYRMHLRNPTVARNGRYLQESIQLMRELQYRGMLKEDADLSPMALFGYDANSKELNIVGKKNLTVDDLHNERIWKDLYNYAKEKLKDYKHEWWKSSDRKKALIAMKMELENIDLSTDDEDTPQKKIEALIKLVNEKSERAIDKDQKVDKDKWRIQGLRNQEGSRFQETLDEIRSKAIASAEKIDSNFQIEYLKKMLNALKERANLTQLSDHKIIKNFSEDEVIKTLIDRLYVSSKSDIYDIFSEMDLSSPKDALNVYDAFQVKSDDSQIEHYKILQKIKERLNFYRSQLRSSDCKDSEKTFVRLFEDIYDRVSEVQRELYVETPENHLRDDLQFALQRLVKNNYVSKKGVDTGSYRNLLNNLDILDKEKDLLSSALYEIQRHIYLYYGKDSVKNFVFNKVEYDKAGNIHIKAEFEEKGSLREFELIVEGFQLNSSEVSCDWPVILEKQDKVDKDYQKQTRTSQSNLLKNHWIFNKKQPDSFASETIELK